MGTYLDDLPREILAEIEKRVRCMDLIEWKQKMKPVNIQLEEETCCLNYKLWYGNAERGYRFLYCNRRWFLLDKDYKCNCGRCMEREGKLRSFFLDRLKTFKDKIK